MSDFTWHLNIEQMQILFVTSQFLLKGHKLLIFFAFFLKISETLKLISLERKQILTNGKELSFWFLTVFHISK